MQLGMSRGDLVDLRTRKGIWFFRPSPGRRDVVKEKCVAQNFLGERIKKEKKILFFIFSMMSTTKSDDA